MKGRRWCFTFYPTDPSEYPTELPSRATYLIFGLESCPTTGRQHLQGYVEWDFTASMAHCQKFLRCTWAPAKGSQEQNIVYCSKENDFVEFGERKLQGQRSDLLDVKLAIDNGATNGELWQQHFSNMTRYHRAFEVYKSITHNTTQRTW